MLQELYSKLVYIKKNYTEVKSVSVNAIDLPFGLHLITFTLQKLFLEKLLTAALVNKYIKFSADT